MLGEDSNAKVFCCIVQVLTYFSLAIFLFGKRQYKIVFNRMFLSVNTIVALAFVWQLFFGEL